MMRKKLQLWMWCVSCFCVLGLTNAFAQPSGYAWDRLGMGNANLVNNSPVNGILSQTTLATSTTNYYLIQWDGYANKWYNTSTPFNQELP